MARGLSNILAEAILISLLLASLSLVSVWQARLIEHVRSDNPVLRLTACKDNVAVLAVDSPGILRVSGDVHAVRVVKSDGTVQELLTGKSSIALGKGEVIVITLNGVQGVATISGYLLVFNFDSYNACSLVKVQQD